MSQEQNRDSERAIELGAGQNPFRDDIMTVDIQEHNNPDIVHNLDEFPYVDENGKKLPDNHFDKVYIHHCLEHLSNWKNALREIHRITKPGGIVNVRVPHFSRNGSPDHKTTFDLFFPDKYLSPGTQEYIGEASFEVMERQLRWRAAANYERKVGSKTGKIFNLIGRFTNPLVNRSSMYHMATKFCYFPFNGFEELEWDLKVKDS